MRATVRQGSSTCQTGKDAAAVCIYRVKSSRQGCDFSLRFLSDGLPLRCAGELRPALDPELILSPLTGVHEGGSLAGKDSIDASSTASIGSAGGGVVFAIITPLVLLAIRHAAVPAAARTTPNGRLLRTTRSRRYADKAARWSPGRRQSARILGSQQAEWVRAVE